MLDMMRQKWSAISLMAKRNLPTNRRELLARLGALTLIPALPRTASGEERQALKLHAKAATVALQPNQGDTPIWSLEPPAPSPPLRFKRGSRLEITLQNDLPLPIVLNWRGLDGVPAAEPLVAQPPLTPGRSTTFSLPLRHSGSLLCDPRLLGDGTERPSRPLPIIIQETDAISDRDEVFLVEDWRIRGDGTALTPGQPPQDTVPIYSVNGQLIPEIAVRFRERLRLRFINGCQRRVIALKFERYDVRVMALDSQPSEPFMARNGALVLAPDGRADILIDATDPPGSTSDILLHDGKEARPVARLVTSTAPPVRPELLPPASALPSNGLPAQLDLRSALRVDLALSGAEWAKPSSFNMSAAPPFRTKTGRVVVLALSNRAETATVFHLHGHHFRSLDRLDDGWKPYWLDTLAIEPGQTQRIAFAAEYGGRWLLEATATDWAAPRLLRWYSVE